MKSKQSDYNERVRYEHMIMVLFHATNNVQNGNCVDPVIDLYNNQMDQLVWEWFKKKLR
jgi:hypothetical protein